MWNFDLSSSSRQLIASPLNDITACASSSASIAVCDATRARAHTHTTTSVSLPRHLRSPITLVGPPLSSVFTDQLKREDVGDVNSPQAVAVLSTGDGVIRSASAAPAALALPGLVLHHLPLIQGMVEAVIHRLQEQEHGSDHAAVDSHDHHGRLQGLIT